MIRVSFSAGRAFSLPGGARKVGETPITLARWKSEYCGLRVDQAKKLKEPEEDMKTSLDPDSTKLEGHVNADLFYDNDPQAQSDLTVEIVS